MYIRGLRAVGGAPLVIEQRAQNDSLACTRNAGNKSGKGGDRQMRIALVGTRGVPARYGGFETCVEQVGLRLVRAGHEVVVYCRTPHDQPRPAEYEGTQLVHCPPRT